MPLKWIWLWFYLFNQTSSHFFFWKKELKSFSSSELHWSYFICSNGSWNRGLISSRKVSVGWWKYEHKKEMYPVNDCVLCILLCPFLKGSEPLAAPAEMLTFPAQTTKLQTLEDEDLTWRKMGGTETASVSTFPFLVQWQRPNSYFQPVSGLPFPMSSKCPILPTGLLGLEEGDVSQKGLYLHWGFLATPAHPFHLLIHCLWRASSMQTWQGKLKAQSTWLTQTKGGTALDKQHESMRNTRQERWCSSCDLQSAQTSDI